MILTNIGLQFFLLWNFNVFDNSAVDNVRLAGKLESPEFSLFHGNDALMKTAALFEFQR